MDNIPAPPRRSKGEIKFLADLEERRIRILVDPFGTMAAECIRRKADKYCMKFDDFFQLHKVWYAENKLKPLSKTSLAMKLHHWLKMLNHPIIKSQIMRNRKRMVIYQGIAIHKEADRKYL